MTFAPPDWRATPPGKQVTTFDAPCHSADMMFRAEVTPLTRILIVAASASALTLGIASVVSAATDTTEPDDPAATHDMGDDTETSTAAMAADGSAEPSSPEDAAFCEAELAAEAAANGGDPALIGPAFEAVVAAAPEEIAAVVEKVVAAAESDDYGPAFTEPYAAMLDYMGANCGYAELNVTASDYAFGGLPPDLAASPTIVYMENIGEEVHEIVIFRINDDVALTADELLGLPEEEAETMATFVGATRVFPGDIGNTVVDLQAGRYVAACFLPEGALPEVLEQLAGLADTPPEGVELGPPHFALGMIHEFQVT